MILQSTDPSRLLIIFIPQLIVACTFLFIAVKLLIRNRPRPIITLSMFYFFTAFGLIFNAIFIVIAAFIPDNELLLQTLYFFTVYPMLISPIFILTFIVSILKLEFVFTIKKQLIITIIYGFVNCLIFFVPYGITFTEQWRPIYSWTFSMCIYIFFTVGIVIPTMIYSRRLIKTFQDKILKKKLVTFIIGVFGTFLILFGAVLYITWQDPLFRSLWVVITFFLMISSAIFIYYGIGREL
ncbi:hypothetical protein ES705_03583 [subsurface metagenome]